MTSVVLGQRYRGPSASANGGYTAGILATTAAPGAPASVRLRLPPPLETPLSIAGDRLLDGDAVVAELTRTEVDLDVPAGVPLPDAVRATTRYAGFDEHPFPGCFACGTGRPPGDGLGLRPGPVAGRELVAAVWEPVAGDTDAATVWAALDCPGAWSVDVGGRPMVLGTIAADVRALPTAGEPHVVLGWHLGTEGRRTATATALYDPAGAVLAVASAIWIAVDPSLFER